MKKSNIDVRSEVPGKMTVTRLGDVRVTAPAPSERSIAKQIIAGKRAAKKLAKLLCCPGIKISKEGPHIPLFWADPDEPRLVIRRLDGVTERGSFVRGKFVKVA